MAGKRRRRKIKSSEKWLLLSLGIGVLAAFGLYKIWPTAPWWVFAVVILLVGGAIYDPLIKQAAMERIVNRESDDDD